MMPQEPKPLTTLFVQYFFLHLAKTGGTSFVQSLEKGLLPPLVPCYVDAKGPHYNICEWTHCHVEMPTATQACNTGASELISLNDLDVDPSVGLLTIIRDPLEHELSMYAHCQSKTGEGQLRHGYPHISFAEYLDFRLAYPENQTFCGYSPFNMQTAKLGGNRTELEAALRVVDSAFWVGVTERYEASICLLRSQLHGRGACTCQESAGRLPKVTHGTHPDDVVLTGRMRSQINLMSGHDAVLHARAMSRLQRDLAHFNLSCLLHM